MITLRMVQLTCIAITGVAWLDAYAEPSVQVNPFEAEYVVKRSGFKLASTRVRLSRQEDQTYVYESLARPAGIMSWARHVQAQEVSRWTMRDDAVVPLEYRYQLLNGDKSRNYHSVFDWAHHAVKIVRQESTSTMNIPDGTLDRFVLQLAVMFDLQHNRETLDYTVLDKSRLKSYRFHIVGNEHIETPAGSFDVVKIESAKDNSSHKRNTAFWCAPSLGYLPVRITYQSKRKPQYNMLLSSVTGLSQ